MPLELTQGGRGRNKGFGAGAVMRSMICLCGGRGLAGQGGADSGLLIGEEGMGAWEEVLLTGCW